MLYYGANELARSFRTVRSNTLIVATDIPEEKYAFRPTPESRSVAEILAHVAVVTRSSYQSYAVRKIATFVGIDFGAVMRERQAMEQQLVTKAQILDALRSGGEAWGGYLDGVTEGDLAHEFMFPEPLEPRSKSRFELILSVKEHEMHHRAQLMVIERLIGIVPHLTRERQERAAQAAAKAAGA
ncbi:MAG: DinB family protein [Acidobacteria bacterium]|nr:DinB family protein [Acidobacteriota bacterium]